MKATAFRIRLSKINPLSNLLFPSSWDFHKNWLSDHGLTVLQHFLKIALATLISDLLSLSVLSILRSDLATPLRTRIALRGPICWTSSSRIRWFTCFFKRRTAIVKPSWRLQEILLGDLFRNQNRIPRINCPIIFLCPTSVPLPISLDLFDPLFSLLNY